LTFASYACVLALVTELITIDDRIPMMAMTTRSSRSVKPLEADMNAGVNFAAVFAVNFDSDFRIVFFMRYIVSIYPEAFK
jgi:hypothetical protein